MNHKLVLNSPDCMCGIFCAYSTAIVVEGSTVLFSVARLCSVVACYCFSLSEPNGQIFVSCDVL